MLSTLLLERGLQILWNSLIPRHTRSLFESTRKLVPP